MGVEVEMSRYSRISDRWFKRQVSNCSISGVVSPQSCTSSVQSPLRAWIPATSVCTSGLKSLLRPRCRCVSDIVDDDDCSSLLLLLLLNMAVASALRAERGAGLLCCCVGAFAPAYPIRQLVRSILRSTVLPVTMAYSSLPSTL